MTEELNDYRKWKAKRSLSADETTEDKKNGKA
jgi:hypothetical protein